MTGFMNRFTQVIMAMAAAAAAWFAAAAWIPMYEAPGRFLLPTALTLLLAVVMALVRDRGLPTAAVIGLECLLAAGVLVGYQVITDPAHWSALHHLGETLTGGAHHLDDYSSPAPARLHDIGTFLLACALLLWAAVDTLGCTLRRPALTGFPLLLALTVPITVLDGRLPVWVLCGCIGSYLLVIATAHALHSATWGRAITAGMRRAPTAMPALGLVAVTLGCALVVSAALPLGHGISHAQGARDAGSDLDLGSPMLDLRRNLVQRTHTPMVTASTDDPDPSYLTLTVLDQFTGKTWRASPRILPPTNSVNGEFPEDPGLSPTQAGENTSWTFALAPTLRTRWLPIPTPVTKIRVLEGDWRYDARTLDVADVSSSGSSGGLEYTVNAFHPHFSAQMLDEAGPPVGPDTDGMTGLPKTLPAVIARTTRTVTRGAGTELNQLVALQRWFRESGGFRYSTRPAPGSGMALLARFITTDKVGYCEQFAAAMAVMARTLGIPSRVVVGFLRPTGRAPSRNAVEFTSDDLHAWPEFYFAGAGWVRFDPTPGTRSGTAPAYTQHLVRHQSTLPQAVPTRAPTKRPSPHPATAPQQDTGSTGSGGSVPWWLVIPVLLVLACAVPALLRGAQRRSRLHRESAADLMIGCWEELRASALDLGLAWPSHGTIRSTLLEVGSHSADPAAGRELRWLAGVLERIWYAPSIDLTDADRARAVAVVETWRRELAAAVTPRAVNRARWLPASLLDRSQVLPAGATRERAGAGRQG